jgi:flagella basal body P-ring formation protein FlgA
LPTMSNAADIRIAVAGLLLLACAAMGAAGDTGAADTFADKVRKALARYAEPGVETAVEVGVIPAGVELPGTAYEVRVSVPAGAHMKGEVRCETEIVVGGDVVRRFPLSVVVRTIGEALVADRLLDRHAVVAAGDVEVQRIETTEYAERPPDGVSELAGLRLKRIVPAGTVLLRSMFEPVPLVRSGRQVTILVRAGSIRVRTSGVARGDGGKGDRVAVRPANGRKEISGVVVANDVVQVTAE